MAYGALGSLASRTEDASSVAGPVSYVLLAGYWGSYMAVASDPEGVWSRLVSILPPTAPFAMPGRIALGATAWWEPLLAVALTCRAIAGLVIFARRVYTAAILRTGPGFGCVTFGGRTRRCPSHRSSPTGPPGSGQTDATRRRSVVTGHPDTGANASSTRVDVVGRYPNDRVADRPPAAGTPRARLSQTLDSSSG
jgi:ABC-2 family transporter protein